MLIMFARGRGYVRALYYTVLYVLCKTLTSPNLTLLYHLMINLLSSHDNSHHHMMNIIYLVKSEAFFSLYAYMTYDQSKELSHSMCIWISLNLETTFLKPKYYIYLILEFNHILLYVVDSTNRQCTHVTSIFSIMLSLRFCL